MIAIARWFQTQPSLDATFPEQMQGKAAEKLPSKVSGKLPGKLPGQLPGEVPGKLSGELPGKVPGEQPRRATTLERKLGVEFQVVDGVVKACLADAEPPPLTVREIAEGFLLWLQGHPQFGDNWVPARMLDELLYPAFAGSISGGDAHTWRAVARHFIRLPGVRRREQDRRTTHGDCLTLYKIPRQRPPK
jgi:hypothetical protein